jgi:multidrug efflux system outer membrane protein
MRRIALLSLCICALSGCAVGPDYHRPSIAVPDAWRNEVSVGESELDIAWWDEFQDPELSKLVHEALANSPDVRIAAARVEQARGVLLQNRGALLPQIGYQGQAERQRANAAAFGVTTPGLPASGFVYKTFTAEATASWEIDLWGRLRRATEGARAQLLSARENKRAVIESLVANVVGSYIALRSLDRQLEISQRTVEGRAENLRIVQKRFDGGVISQVDLSQTQSEYEQAVASIPAVRNSIEKQENALSLLIGRNPGNIDRGASLDELKAPDLAAGTPSDFLERRPDIRAAEQDLIAANALIGEARARYFPSLSLTGALGSVSLALEDLFTPGTRTWSYAGAISGPIFSGGTIHGDVVQAKGQKAELLARYQQTIQSAFRDVEDALSDRFELNEQLESQARQIDALRTYARLSRRRYDNGYTAYLEVLDAERTLFNAEINYTQSQQQVLQASVNLYKSLGGGWIDLAATEVRK